MTVLIFLSVIMLLVALVVVVKTQPQGRHVSISQHAASRRWTYMLFGSSLTLFGSVFLAFLYSSLGPKLGAPTVFNVILLIGWMSIMLTAWVPDTKVGRKSQIHWLASMALACTMTAIIASLAFAQHIGVLPRVFAAGITAWYCYTLYLFFFVKESHRHFLVYQSINIVTFFGVIGMASLVGN